MSQVNYIDLAEFIKLGFLQEINRLVLHPCGLALEMSIETDENGNFEEEQTSCTMKVWDYREDPEGICFHDTPSRDKALSVDAIRRKHYACRAEMYGELDHNHESYSIFLTNPDQYGSDTSMPSACHPPDVQPVEPPTKAE